MNTWQFMGGGAQKVVQNFPHGMWIWTAPKID